MAQVRNPFGVGVDSDNRLSVVLGNLGHMARSEWFVQLGDAWSMCDNVAACRPVLRRLLRSASRTELDLMMTPGERKTLAAAPDCIEVWRGCYAINRAGLSWSTDRTIAERFPFFNRYARHYLGEQPILRHGTVRKERAVLKLDRGEVEIIAPCVFGISETALRKAEQNRAAG